MLTMQNGYEAVRIIGVYTDRVTAFDRLESMYDAVVSNGEELGTEYGVTEVTQGDVRGWVFGTGDYDDCVKLFLFVDQTLSGGAVS